MTTAPKGIKTEIDLKMLLSMMVGNIRYRAILKFLKERGLDRIILFNFICYYYDDDDAS